MIDCGACGGKGSARELNLPIVKGLVGDKAVDLLRDTGCEGVVVCRGLVDDDQLTGKCCLIIRIDNTVLLAEKARIQVKTPYLWGEVEALCIPEAICDLVVKNVAGAWNPDGSDMTAMVGAVTRAQARQEVRHKPLTVPDTRKHSGVDWGELIRLQQNDEAIKRMGETAISENRVGRKYAGFLVLHTSTTTPYHPMCNGLVKKFRGTLKKMLKRLCNEKPKQWH